MAPSTSTPKSPPPLGDEEEDEESPVTEPPIGQSYQKLSFCFIEHLKSACASYGPTAPFTLALWRTKEFCIDINVIESIAEDSISDFLCTMAKVKK
ncbi:hypothetical protein STEG23_003055 [Scotinomys teguina]